MIAEVIVQAKKCKFFFWAVGHIILLLTLLYIAVSNAFFNSKNSILLRPYINKSVVVDIKGWQLKL